MTTRAVVPPRPRHLLARLLDTPNLARVVQGLEPRVLHRLVRHCGLEDCGEIVALATTEQLMRVFDDDLWRSDEAGAEDRFDAERFGLWLEVLVEMGPSAAAAKVADMDFDFVAAAISRHILVLDQEPLLIARVMEELGFDKDEPTESAWNDLIERALEGRSSHEFGAYTVVARRSASWDAVLFVLTSLERDHRAFFARLMKRCCRISTEHVADNGGLYEVLTADEQAMADIAADRESRREEEGYVTPAQAAAFLRLCRQRDAGLGGPSGFDTVTASYFRELDHRARAGRHRHARHQAASAGDGPRSGATDHEVSAFLEALQEGGVLHRPRPPRLPKAMADGGDRLSRIRAPLRFVREHDPAAYSRRTEELAYLANVLVSGCTFESRRFRAVEAADAVLAVCNLGLENWGRAPAADADPTPSPEFLVRQDLVSVFRAGWSVLYEDVCLFTAKRLVETLSTLRCDDREVRGQIRELALRLKTQLQAGTPWEARDDLDAIALLDQPSWAILLRLVDQCPVVPTAAERSADGPAPLRVSEAFEFVSENAQVAWVRGFLESLPERLAGGSSSPRGRRSTSRGQSRETTAGPGRIVSPRPRAIEALDQRVRGRARRPDYNFGRGSPRSTVWPRR